ncbi:MAG: putative toxin-antitoxin system toxin component, PIN family [Caldilineaceae bacterium]
MLDTNLVISAALLDTSYARKVFETALSLGEILLSQAVQTELSDVFMRSKFDRYVSPLRRLQFLANLIAIATTVQVTETIRICRDPKDDKFLELAVSGQAVCIISGDKDLLVLHPFQGISILSPTDFLAQYSPQN